MKRLLNQLCLGLIGLASLSAPSTSYAEDLKICVFDPAGKSGDYYAIMQDYAIAASGWGVDLSVQAYTDEETAAKDYQAGQCAGVVATGVRLQSFNHFPSTIEAIGAVPNYPLLKQMIYTLDKYPSAGAMLKKDGNMTVGFIPVGAVYLFVRDRTIDSVSELAGKRIATMDYDTASPVMVERIGAIVVPADLGSIGPKFNNGSVDACYLSAPAYQPFELWRGLEHGGGILKSPLAQGTLQVMLKESLFPAGFGKKSQTYFVGQFDKALALVKKAEDQIPEKYWVPIDPKTAEGWDELFLGVRLKLRDQHHAYDPAMLGALRKLRCAQDSSRVECVEQKE